MFSVRVVDRWSFAVTVRSARRTAEPLVPALAEITTTMFVYAALVPACLRARYAK